MDISRYSKWFSVRCCRNIVIENCIFYIFLYLYLYILVDVFHFCRDYEAITTFIICIRSMIDNPVSVGADYAINYDLYQFLHFYQINPGHDIIHLLININAVWLVCILFLIFVCNNFWAQWAEWIQNSSFNFEQNIPQNDPSEHLLSDVWFYWWHEKRYNLLQNGVKLQLYLKSPSIHSFSLFHKNGLTNYKN